MKELIKAGDSVTIKDNTVKVIEYKGHRVLSSYTIAQLHGREVKRVNEQFERNKTRLQEGVDYFLIGREEFEVADSDHKISSKARHQFERLFTERGYLKLVKSFTDDLSWEVQDLLVDSYFKLKEALQPKHMCFLDIMTADEEVDRALAIRKLDQTVIKPLEVKVEYQAKVIEDKEKVIETQATEITQAKPKVSYYDIILQSEDLMSITEIAKDYGISAVRLNKILESESVQYKYHKDWNLYHHYKTQGLTATTTHRVKGGYVKTTLKWNQKGRLFIHDLLKSLNIFATMDEERIAPEPLSHKSFRYIYRNTKSDKPFEKWAEEYRKDLVPRKDYELNAVTMPNSGVTMVDWTLTGNTE